MHPRIIALCGPSEGLVFSLPDTTDVYIGRGKNNHVRIADPRLALEHCLIEVSDEHCVLFAIDYERGTFVNEFSRPGKMLVHGDRIKLGVSILLFVDLSGKWSKTEHGGSICSRDANHDCGEKA
jgi:predicted component of type VI protein secretion system